MYELRGGTRRLSNVLYQRLGDDHTITMLTDILDYDRRQLVQDIQALDDYVRQAEARIMQEAEEQGRDPWADVYKRS